MRDNLKILYSFPMRLGVTGIGMTAWNQVYWMSKKNVKIYLYCASCEKKVPDNIILIETLKFFGCKIPFKLLFNYNAKIHDKIVSLSLINKIYEKIDLIHCWPSGALKTLQIGKIKGIKTFLERPSAHTEQVFQMNKKIATELKIRTSKKNYFYYDKKKLKHQEKEFELSDILLCPSDFVKKTFTDKGYNKRKLYRHHYGYDPDLFNVNRETLKKSNSKFKMLYVGLCSALKGVHFALEAWCSSELLKTSNFIICGDIIKEYKSILAKWLNSDNVKYINFISNPYSLSNLMKDCNALIIPSLSEGSALVTYEARACGCVILASDASGVVGDHLIDCLIHPAGDISCIKYHMELSWEKAAESLINAYQKGLQSNQN